jgi:hypothetical protein
MKPKDSLAHTQEPIPEPCPDPAEFSPHPQNIFFINTILQSMPRSLPSF